MIVEQGCVTRPRPTGRKAGADLIPGGVLNARSLYRVMNAVS